MILFIILILILFFLYNNESFNNTNKIDYYVIHLKRNPERIDNILKNEEKLKNKINIYNAIDGRLIKNINDLKEYDKNLINNFPTALIGEIGCYLSHLLIIKQIENNDNYTVIFEDDLNIEDNNLHEKILEIVNKVNDFDMIYLGNTSDNVGEKYIDNIYQVDPNKHLWGMHSYLIKNKNAKKIYDSLLNIDDAIDVKTKKLFDLKKLNAYVIYPRLVNQLSYMLGSTTRT